MPGEENITAICGQMGGKYPMGFIFTSVTSDFTDLTRFIELDFEGLSVGERMKILEVARLDAEFWTKFELITSKRLRHSVPSITHKDHSNEEDVKALQENTNSEITIREEVREHIEIFVTVLLGRSIDAAAVGNLYHDQKYIDFFATFHPLITRSLSRLSLSVYKAIRGESLLTEDLPTSAHALAKTVILEAQKVALSLPKMKVSEGTNTGNIEPTLNSFSDSYEGLLATAVLNTAVGVSQGLKKEFGIQTDAPSAVSGKTSKVDTGVQSDLPFSDSESDDGSVLSSSTYPLSTPFTETADEFSWHYPQDGSDGGIFNSDVTVVEEVEEIITVFDESGEKRRVYNGTLEKFLMSLGDFHENEGTTKTTFPEFGVDIIEGSYEEIDPSNEMEYTAFVRRSVVDNWEENWLFRQRKDSAPSLVSFNDCDEVLTNLCDEPLGMLVPMPNENLSPMIGDKEADLASELSERNSYGSIDFSSSGSEGDIDDTGQEISLTEQPMDSLEQKERDSTEQYACLPCRLFSPLTSLPTVVEPFSEEVDENELKIPYFLQPGARPVYENPALRFLVKPENLTVGLERRLKAHCRPVAGSKVGVAWFLRGQRVVANERVRISNDHGTFVLEIYNTSHRDSGRYSVVAYTSDSQIWKEFSVRVVGRHLPCSLPSLRLASPVSQVFEGQDAKITGEVQGHPEPVLSLVGLSQQQRIILDQGSSGVWAVVIRHATLSDSGSYKLLASNRLGETTLTLQLIVNSKSEYIPPKSDENEVLPPVPLKRSKVPRKVVEVLPIPRLRTRISDSSDSLNQQIAESHELKSTSVGIDQILLALPGSIAEREHRKWSQAVPMPNNPYSAESLKRRLESKNFILDLKDPCASSRSFNIDLNDQVPVCDNLEEGWMDAYRRDYEIAPEKKESTHTPKQEEQPMSLPALICDRKPPVEIAIPPINVQLRSPRSQKRDSVKDKIQAYGNTQRKSESGVSSDPCGTRKKADGNTQRKSESGVSSDPCGTRKKADGNTQRKSDSGESADPCRTHQRVSENIQRTSDSGKNAATVDKLAKQKKVKNVKNERSKSKEKLKSAQQLHEVSQAEAQEVIESPSLPSVRQLATLFKVPEDETVSDLVTAKMPARPGSREVLSSLLEESHLKEHKVTIKGMRNLHDDQGLFRVHSLTARSVPQEFRRGLDLGKTRQQDRNIKIPSPTHSNSEPGVKDIAALSLGLSGAPVDVGGKKVVKRSIAKRAAFWDNRIVNEIVDDAQVVEDFPEMTEM